MSTHTLHACDVCQRQIGIATEDLGVWFRGGAIGLADVCVPCQAVTTIEQVRKLIGIEIAPLKTKAKKKK